MLASRAGHIGAMRESQIAFIRGRVAYFADGL